MERTLVQELLKQTVDIQKKYSIKLDYAVWKNCIDKLAQIRLEATRLVKKTMAEPSGLKAKAELLYALNVTCKRVNSSSVFGFDTNHQQREKEKIIAEILENVKKVQASKEAVSKKFAGEDFATGISDISIILQDYPQNFNGNFTKTIHLSAARREYEPFQIILMPQARMMKNVIVTATDLTGTKGTISKNNIEIAPMGWRLDTDSIFKADMLRPDIKTFDVKADQQQPVWINIFVPEDTTPGDYAGEIKISAMAMKSQTIKVKLKVWPFTLPVFASLKNAIGITRQTGSKGRALSKMVNSHRFNYSSIYEWRPVSLAEREKNLERGTSMFNLLRCKNSQSYLEKVFFKNADQMFNEMKNKNPELLKRCYVYGFDEVGLNNVPDMEKVFGEVKKRYNNIKTMSAVNKQLWKHYSNVKNLDIWVLTLGMLTPEVKRKLEKNGREVWWYNLVAQSNDPFSCRVQFWGTFKDKLSGVLFYNLKAGSVGRYQSTLYPTMERLKDYSFNLIRTNQDAYPISSVAFECWREGMEDYDYLIILQNLKNKLVAQKQFPELVRQAENLLNVPDFLTKGMMSGWTQSSRDGCLYESCDSNADLNDIRQYRQQLGETIAKIYKHLNP